MLIIGGGSHAVTFGPVSSIYLLIIYLFSIYLFICLLICLLAIDQDVTHNCGASARFLGMKATYYLVCSREPVEQQLEVSVAAATFVSCPSEPMHVY